MESKTQHLLTAKELAFALRKHVTYIYAMKRLGFKMPGRVATLQSAIIFLEQHPEPRGGGKTDPVQ